MMLFERLPKNVLRFRCSFFVGQVAEILGETSNDFLLDIWMQLAL